MIGFEKRWRWMAAGLALGGASPALGAPCDVVRVMSFNIRLDTPADGENRWDRRRDAFVGQIDWMQPDILGLQEVLPDQKRDLEKALPGYVVLGEGRDGGERGESSSLAIASRTFRVGDRGTFWLSQTPGRSSKGWDAAYPRIATWARLVRRSDGKRFLALNTHLDHVGAIAKLQGARQIAAFLTANRRPDEAVVMTGDLNSLPDSPPLSALSGEPAGLRDSRTGTQMPAIGPGGTFNAFNPLPDTQQRIDYVLHGAGLKTRRHATLAWHGEGGRVASDHFAVVADLVDARCKS